MECLQVCQPYPWQQFRQEFIHIHRSARREPYCYPLLEQVLRPLCPPDRMVVPVYDNKRSSLLHNTEIYAAPGGLQDLIVVPRHYTYEAPQPPLVTVEAKRPQLALSPEGLVEQYLPLKLRDREGRLNGQLEVQLQKTDFLLFTDCITWHLLQAGREPWSICLLRPQAEGWAWPESAPHPWSQEDLAFYQTLGMDVSHVGREPEAWTTLMDHLRDFLEVSRQKA